MGIEPFRIRDIPKGKLVQLLTALASKGVQGQQNGPGEKQSDATYHREHIEVTEKEEALERRAIENFNVWSFPERYNPIEPS
jgi:hypothetical protein